MSVASTAGEAVTRCPCGDNDDQLGLMIQCEVCSVWQHSECVGVTEQTVPEKYYCDACMPDHPIHVRNRTILSALPSRGISKDFAKLKKGYTKTGPPGERKRKNRKEEEVKEETKLISREERKLKNIIQTFERLENRGRRRADDGGQVSKNGKHEGRTKPDKSDLRRGKFKKPKVSKVREDGLSVSVDAQSDGPEALSPSSSSSSSPASPSPLELPTDTATFAPSFAADISSSQSVTAASVPSTSLTSTTTTTTAIPRNVTRSSAESSSSNAGRSSSGGRSENSGENSSAGVKDDTRPVVNANTITFHRPINKKSNNNNNGVRTNTPSEHSHHARGGGRAAPPKNSRSSQPPTPPSDPSNLLPAASPADRKRSKELARPPVRQDERKPKTPKVATPKPKRPREGQPPSEASHWERRRLSPLAPLYLGKQSYILSMVHAEQLTSTRLDSGVDGWRANLLDTSLPVKLRVLNALRRP